MSYPIEKIRNHIKTESGYLTEHAETSADITLYTPGGESTLTDTTVKAALDSLGKRTDRILLYEEPAGEPSSQVRTVRNREDQAIYPETLLSAVKKDDTQTAQEYIDGLAAKTVAGSQGVHGIRYFADSLEVYQNQTWMPVTVSGGENPGGDSGNSGGNSGSGSGLLLGGSRLSESAVYTDVSANYPTIHHTYSDQAAELFSVSLPSLLFGRYAVLLRLKLSGNTLAQTAFTVQTSAGSTPLSQAAVSFSDIPAAGDYVTIGFVSDYKGSSQSENPFGIKLTAAGGSALSDITLDIDYLLVNYAYTAVTAFPMTAVPADSSEEG
ncbi:hypothetical protein [Anaerolentibacter hominis]|uniref:hypothetical protein n=1 Tax=Anaerolentibacter hominis TaxID=3079009 RepID=UPI0031B87FD0